MYVYTNVCLCVIKDGEKKEVKNIEEIKGEYETVTKIEKEDQI